MEGTVIEILVNFGVMGIMLVWFAQEFEKKDTLVIKLLEEFSKTIDNNTKAIEMLREELRHLDGLDIHRFNKDFDEEDEEH